MARAKSHQTVTRGTDFLPIAEGHFKMCGDEKELGGGHWSAGKRNLPLVNGTGGRVTNDPRTSCERPAAPRTRDVRPPPTQTLYGGKDTTCILYMFGFLQQALPGAKPPAKGGAAEDFPEFYSAFSNDTGPSPLPSVRQTAAFCSGGSRGAAAPLQKNKVSMITG